MPESSVSTQVSGVTGGAGADTPAAGEVAGDSPQLVTVQELAGLAATMLRMMLELYGAPAASF